MRCKIIYLQTSRISSAKAAGMAPPRCCTATPEVHLLPRFFRTVSRLETCWNPLPGLGLEVVRLLARRHVHPPAGAQPHDAPSCTASCIVCQYVYDVECRFLHPDRGVGMNAFAAAATQKLPTLL